MSQAMILGLRLLTDSRFQEIWKCVFGCSRNAEQRPFELRLTVRESQSQGSGASLDVREGSMPAMTLLPGA